jgi:hypothetical protein
MAICRKNGHIDPDLSDVFVKGKVYLKQARQFLDSQLSLRSMVAKTVEDRHYFANLQNKCTLTNDHKPYFG